MDDAWALMLVHWQEQGGYDTVHHHQLRIERKMYHSLAILGRRDCDHEQSSRANKGH